MFRKLTHRSTTLLAGAAITACLVVAAPALADHDSRGRSWGFGAGNGPGWGFGYGQPTCRLPERTQREFERERGERDGYRAGYNAGFEDGYAGRASHCECRIDISCESPAYQRGFRAAFDDAYERGFFDGRARRDRDRCPSYGGWQIRLRF